MNPRTHPIRILLVEDNPGDVRLTVEAFKDGKVDNPMDVVRDGVEALAYLRQEGAYRDRPLPDLILLDLNLPRMDGREVLAAVKADVRLKHIPVVVLTTSAAEQDVQKSYLLQASCFITKPVDFGKFAEVVRGIDSFYLSIVTLPPQVGS
ncbi:response regulator [Sulfuritalea sp.]|uniref:response regulator n=1 Tax=Sulfuritalea sp. TaxID=2480090 RepID=UPI00286D79D7|nr:response regulator [Sulfuritalea sp.]